MLIKAESKNLRTTPRKLRLLADLVRPMPVEEALTTLTHLKKRAAPLLYKTIKQATANAINNLNLPKSSLKIHSIEINEGPTLKRFRPVSKGRAHRILKRTSHIKVILEGQSTGTKKRGK